jgi:hypothetical protein
MQKKRVLLNILAITLIYKGLRKHEKQSAYEDT